MEDAGFSQVNLSRSKHNLFASAVKACVAC